MRRGASRGAVAPIRPPWPTPLGGPDFGAGVHSHKVLRWAAGGILALSGFFPAWRWAPERPGPPWRWLKGRSPRQASLPDILIIRTGQPPSTPENRSSARFSALPPHLGAVYEVKRIGQLTSHLGKVIPPWATCFPGDRCLALYL
jgi:hypothetical protein